MASTEHDYVAPGRYYRVGRAWYLDTALLNVIARRITVEPMQSGYQILAPGGLVRCVPARGLALPGQTGELYRCQGQRADQDVGPRLRKLAGAHGADALGGEWDEWPESRAAAAPVSCGCSSCKVGGACCGGADHAHEAGPASLFERLLISETLGTVDPRTLTSGAVALYPARHAAPEWACGRYHECIASILHFPDVEPGDWIVLVEVRHGKAALTWGVTLDRRRTLMLQEIVERATRLVERTARLGAVLPALPSKQTPGYQAWSMAAELAPRGEPCERCGYRLGTNLRCPICRQWLLRRKRVPDPAQDAAILKILAEQKDLRSVPPSVLRQVARSVAESHARNPYAPLTDLFFVRLERDVLLAAQSLKLDPAPLEAVLEVAELTTLEVDITLGSAARKEAA